MEIHFVSSFSRVHIQVSCAARARGEKEKEEEKRKGGARESERMEGDSDV
jgi:hypothetical protein